MRLSLNYPFFHWGKHWTRLGSGWERVDFPWSSPHSACALHWRVLLITHQQLVTAEQHSTASVLSLQLQPVTSGLRVGKVFWGDITRTAGPGKTAGAVSSAMKIKTKEVRGHLLLRDLSSRAITAYSSPASLEVAGHCLLVRSWA